MKNYLIKAVYILPAAILSTFTLVYSGAVLALDFATPMAAYEQFPAIVRQALKLALWLLPLALVFMPVEHFFARRKHKLDARTALADLGFYFINGLVPGLLLAMPLSLIASGSGLMVPESAAAAIVSWPIWVRVAIALVVNEIGTYWGHRLTHSIPFLWRFHSIHHAPEEMYFLTSTRAHPVDKIFLRFCGLTPVYLLGIASPFTPDGLAVSAILLLALYLWGFFIHSNLSWRIGPLEWLITTPGFHHWHHTKSDHRDRNFSPMLPLVDWIFGTFHLPEKQWPSDYGIEKRLPNTLHGQLLHPFRNRIWANTANAVPIQNPLNRTRADDARTG
jgi:sterol desaturase/sphingolipid hydroxylase (fatty acid hydroxylase superfamily)